MTRNLMLLFSASVVADVLADVGDSVCIVSQCSLSWVEDTV